MKAEELRIGNLVLVDGVETTITNLEITEGEIVDPIDPQPIPITEDRLKRLGFVHDYQELAEDSYTITIGNETLLRVERDGSYGFEDSIPIKGWDIDYVCGGVNLKYLHQLQNLYFALTGEELNEER